MSVTTIDTTNEGTDDKEDCVCVHQFKYVSFCWSNRKRNGGEEKQSNALNWYSEREIWWRSLEDAIKFE